MKNKYNFFKGLYKDYVVLLESKGKIKTFGMDKNLEKYIKKGDINYIVVYNDFNVDIMECSINNYRKYLLKEFIMDILNIKK